MTGIILINFGGPDKCILSFLRDILKDVLPRPLKPFAGIFARLRLPRAKRMYAAIGGTSPVVEWTTRQARELERRLNTPSPRPSPPPVRQRINGGMGEGEGGGDTQYRTYIAMKYGEPTIDAAIADAKKDGCERIVLLPLFFYRSRYTGCHSRWSPRKRGLPPKVLIGGGDDKLLIDIINLSLADWRNIPPPQVTLLFTAHSIPSRAAKDEPYVRQISESAAKIMEHFTGYNFQLAYQSAPFGFGWLGPDVKSAIRQIGLSSPRKRGPRVDTRDPRVREDDKHYLLIVPLGFACENLETLYELDQIYVPYAQRLGLNVKRAPAPNVHPIFIDLLAKMVLSKVNLQGLSFPR